MNTFVVPYKVKVRSPAVRVFLKGIKTIATAANNRNKVHQFGLYFLKKSFNL